jgi:hypothetical protein
MRHLVRFTIAVLALAAAPSALAGGPALGTTAALADGAVNYVTVPEGDSTTLTARNAAGKTLRQTSVKGSWGIPLVTISSVAGGLSHNGRVLVLAQSTHPDTLLRSRTGFVVVDTRKLAIKRTIDLKGDFGFDALSPNGRMLYLIENLPSGEGTRYRVRAFDLATGRLLPQVIADQRQKKWLMNGYPAGRIASGNGRWVYTLYANPNNYPFVHALDSVSKRAVCIGLPWEWTGNMQAMETATMKLSPGDRRLTIIGDGGFGPKFVIDTKTFKLLPAGDGQLASSS